MVNESNGSLPLLSGEHDLRLCACNPPGAFTPGRLFRVVAVRPDGTLAWSPTVTY